MYLAISAQKMGSTYNSSVGNYVDYLEKENEDRLPEQREEFFDQENDSVSPQTVIDEIDANTAKLKQKDPKFYSIVVSPNQRELKATDPYPHHSKQKGRDKHLYPFPDGKAQGIRSGTERKDGQEGI